MSNMEKMLKMARGIGIEAEDLDGDIYDMAASIANSVNKNGLEDQIRYLSENREDEDIVELLQNVKRKKDSAKKA